MNEINFVYHSSRMMFHKYNLYTIKMTWNNQNIISMRWYFTVRNGLLRSYKINLDVDLRAHLRLLHFLFSLASPLQGFPPFRASSLIDLSRYWKPPPQVLSQSVHSENLLHWQSILPSTIRLSINRFRWWYQCKI